MKTSSRKRLLISSVAMLLVAMLALGTATYAWFTTNPNANASGLKLKATASKGLMIQTESHGAVTPSFWGHDDYLNYDGTTHVSKTTPIALNPTSFDLSDATALGTGYTVDAADSGSFAAAGTNKVSTATGGIGTGDYFQEKIYCKVTGGESSGTLTMTGLTVDANTDLDMISAMRIAISYNDTLVGVYTATGTATNNYLKAPAGYESGTTTYNAFTTTEKLFAAYSGTKNLGAVTDEGDDYVTVTIYLDGENGNCYSDIIDAANLINSVKVDLKVI